MSCLGGCGDCSCKEVDTNQKFSDIDNDIREKLKLIKDFTCVIATSSCVNLAKNVAKAWYYLWCFLKDLVNMIKFTNSRIDGLCSLITNQIAPATKIHALKPSVTMRIDNNKPEPVFGGVGIEYGQILVKGCNGKDSTLYEWLKPRIEWAYLSNVKSGTTLGTIDTTTLKSWGISDNIINQLTVYSASWSSGTLLNGRSYARLMLDIDPKKPTEFKLVYLNSMGERSDTVGANELWSSDMSSNFWVVRTNMKG